MSEEDDAVDADVPEATEELLFSPADASIVCEGSRLKESTVEEAEELPSPSAKAGTIEVVIQNAEIIATAKI